jgi:hypothetical protein
MQWLAFKMAKEEKGDHLCLAGNLSVQKMLAKTGSSSSSAHQTPIINTHQHSLPTINCQWSYLLTDMMYE